MNLYPVDTYFAKALEAVFAITVLARLETAVITSISFSEVGGLSLTLLSLGGVTSHDGIWRGRPSTQISEGPDATAPKGISRCQRGYRVPSATPAGIR